MIKKYKKKQITIEAVQWTGDNLKEIVDFLGFSDFENFYKNNVTADVGEYILKGVDGKFHTCHPYTFRELYKEVDAGVFSEAEIVINNDLDSIQAFTIPKENYYIQFFDENNETMYGKLYLTEDKKLAFEGDMEKSGEVFIKYLQKLWGEAYNAKE